MKIHNFFLSLFIIFNLGCGTDTGNPTLTSPIPVSAIVEVTSGIAANLCQKIYTCFGTAPTNCTTAIRTTSLLPTNLGLNETTYPNFDVIQNALNINTLQADFTKANNCFNAIYSRSCSDTTVQQSYNTSSPQNLTQIWRLLNLDANCNQFIF